MRLLWIVLMCLCGLAAAAPANPLQGTVVRVTDGDSLWLEPSAPGTPPVELRLEGIDAPEICQAWGPEAKQALAERVLGQQVSVKTVGRDSHGRTLGTLYLGTQNINKLMVQEGHAWSSRYKFDRGPYVADERMAKALSRGFNGAGSAIMPRDFRRLNGPCHAPAGAMASAAQLASVAPGARCDGRKRCAQMRSCEEASWFLKNCPGVEMDGDGDGVPCERQWCRP